MSWTLRTWLFGIMAAAGLAASPGTVRAEGEGLVLLWLASPKGDGSVEITSSGDVRVSFREEVAFEDRSTISGFAFQHGGDIHQVRFTLMEGPLEAGGRQLPGEGRPAVFDQPVISSVQTLLARAEYRYRMGTGVAGAGPILGLQYVKLDARLRATEFLFRADDQQAVVPVLGLFGYLRPLPFLSFQAEFLFSRIRLGGYDASSLEAAAEARAHLTPYWFAGLGIRHISVDAKGGRDDLQIDADLSGPVLFTGFTW